MRHTIDRNDSRMIGPENSPNNGNTALMIIITIVSQKSLQKLLYIHYSKPEFVVRLFPVKGCCTQFLETHSSC